MKCLRNFREIPKHEYMHSSGKNIRHTVSSEIVEGNKLHYVFQHLLTETFSKEEFPKIIPKKMLGKFPKNKKSFFLGGIPSGNPYENF